MRKSKLEQRFQESFVSDNIDRTSNNGPRFDLMSLGIELDDDLIERLQKNLGIEKIFSIAQKSASLIKNKPQLPIGAIPEMTYRNVSEDGSKRNSSVLKPFEKDMPHTDNKFSMSILKELSDSESRIDGKYRPLLDKMIERYRLQYMRSPERFVCNMLGRAMKASDHLGTDSMSRLVLRTRYVNSNDFAVMIRRIDSAAESELIDALFHLFSVDKSFAGSSSSAGALSSSVRRRGGDILDLWEFITLLKTSADEARRSFDCRTSRLATDVEFWRRSNFNLSMGSGGGGGSVGADTNEKFQAERNKRINGMSNNTHRCFDGTAGQKGGDDAAARKNSHQSRSGQVITVSQLLGQSATPVSNSNRLSSHGSKGTLIKERRNQCDIPTALNSPLRNPSRPVPRKTYTAVNAGAASQEENRPSFNTFGGSRVGDLLSGESFAASSGVDTVDDTTVSYTSGNVNVGFADGSNSRRSQSANRARRSPTELTRSASFLAREFTDKTSVADAVCGATESHPRAVSNGRRSRQFSRSFSQNEGSLDHTARVNRSADGIHSPHTAISEQSVAAVMGGRYHESTSSTMNQDGTISARRCGSMGHLATNAASPRKGTSLW